MPVYGYTSLRTNSRFGPYQVPSATGQLAMVGAGYFPDGGSATVTVMRLVAQKITGATVTALEPEHSNTRSPNQAGASGTAESVTGAQSGNPFALLKVGVEQTFPNGHYAFPRPLARYVTNAGEVSSATTNVNPGTGIQVAYGLRFTEGGGLSAVDRVARRPREHGWWHRSASKRDKVQAGTTPPASRQNVFETANWNVMTAARQAYLREHEPPFAMFRSAPQTFSQPLSDTALTHSDAIARVVNRPLADTALTQTDVIASIRARFFADNALQAGAAVGTPYLAAATEALTGSFSSVTITTNATVSAGDTLFIAVANRVATAGAAVVSSVSGITADEIKSYPHSTLSNGVSLIRIYNGGAGVASGTTITLNFSVGGVQRVVVAAFAASGVANANVDQEQGADEAAGSSFTVTAAGATTGAPAIEIGVAVKNASATTSTGSPGTGWVELVNQEVGTATFTIGYVEYRITSSNETPSAVFNWSDATGAGAALVAAWDAAGGGGAGMSDVIAAAKSSVHTFSYGLADTALTHSDSIGRLVTRPLSDTAVTLTDSIATLRARPSLSDTAITQTDAITSRRARPLTDTALTQTDQLVAVRARPFADTALTFSDQLTAIRVRPFTDTAMSQSDSLRKTVSKGLTDTALTLTDSPTRGSPRLLADTVVTASDAILTVRARPLSDTIVTQSDQIGPRAARPITDTAVTFSDTLQGGHGFTRGLSDTAVTHSDAVVRSPVARPLTDTAVTHSDAITRRAPRPLTDTAMTQTDTLIAVRVRALTDTALTATDSIRKAASKPITDTALTQTDTLRRPTAAGLMDTIGTQVSIDAMSDASYGVGTMGVDGYGNPWTDNGPGTATITKTGGTAALTLPASGVTQNQRETLLDLPGGNQDATLEFDFPAFANVSMQADILLRYTTGNFYRFRTNVSSGGAITVSIAANSTSLVSTSGGTMIAGQKYWMRGRVGSAGDLYLKFWKDGTPEPQTWLLATTDTSITGVGAPGFRFAANAGLSASATLNVHRWTATAGVGDSDVIGFSARPGTVQLYDTASYMTDPARYPPAAGTGVTVGVGARTVTHPENFDLARTQTIAGTLGMACRWGHSLADFTATATAPGPQGLNPLGVEERIMVANGMVPICGLGGRLSGADWPGWTGVHGSGEQALIDIANGVYDSTIFAWAQALKAVGATVMCRLWREPSGGHPWWCAIDPGNYIAAWKRVFTIFRGTAADYAAFNATIPGLTGSPTTAPAITGTPTGASNCLFEWCVGTASWWNNDGSVGPAQAQLNFYPGNSYVDWLSVDGYGTTNTVPWDNADFANHFKTGYAPVSPQGTSWYTWAAAKGLPLMVSETGASPDAAGTSGPGATPLDTDWINSILTGVQAMPLVRAVVLWIGQNTYPATTPDGATSAAQTAYQTLFGSSYMRTPPASDSVGAARLVPRGLTDTALTSSDVIGKAVRKPLADTAMSFSDVLAKGPSVALASTALTLSDSLAAVRGRALIDTAMTQSDTVRRAYPRGLADNALQARIVGTPYAAGTGADATAGGATVAMTTTTAIPAGDTLLLAIGVRSLTPVASSATFAGIQAPDEVISHPSGTGQTLSVLIARFFLASGLPSGTTITATLNQTSNRRMIAAVGVPALANQAVDQSAGADTASTNPSTSAPQSIPSAFALAVWSVATSDGTTPVTPGTGWTTLANVWAGTATWGLLFAEYMVLSAQQTVTPTKTITASQTGTTQMVGVWDAGVSVGLFDTLSRGVQRAGLADNALALADSITVAATRRLSDTALTQTDSLAGGHAYARGPSDTALTQTDVLAHARGELLTDTALTHADAISAGPRRPLADTAVTSSDSILAFRPHPVGLSDTAVTFSDVLLRIQPTSLVDQVVTASDQITKRQPRGLTDSALTASDAVGRTFPRGLSSTALTLSDQLARLPAPRISDFALNLGDHLHAATTHGLTDTALTGSDMIAAQPATGLVDTALVQTDAVTAARAGGLADTALVLADQVTVAALRRLTSTALVLTDTIGRAFPRALADTALALSDQLRGARPRGLADTAVTQADSIRPRFGRPITDTVIVLSDVLLAGARPRLITDTVVTLSDALLATRPRPLTDRIVTPGDVIGRIRPLGLSSVALVLSDSVSAGPTRPGLLDTILALTDRVAPTPRRGPTDTLTFSDVLRTAPRWQLADVALVAGDAISRRVATRLTDQALTASDTIRTGGAARALADMVMSFADVLRPRFGRPVMADTALTLSDRIGTAQVLGRFLSDVAATIVEAISRRVHRPMADVAASISDSLGPRARRSTLTDTALVQADQLARIRLAALTDQAATITDALRRPAVARPLIDHVLTPGDVIAGGYRRQITDTALTLTDQLVHPLRRGITDTATTLSDQLRRAGYARFADTVVRLSDAILRTLRIAPRPGTAELAVTLLASAAVTVTLLDQPVSMVSAASAELAVTLLDEPSSTITILSTVQMRVVPDGD